MQLSECKVGMRVMIQGEPVEITKISSRASLTIIKFYDGIEIAAAPSELEPVEEAKEAK